MEEKFEKNKCNGCYPTYQFNQLAHMDYGRCLYTDIDNKKCLQVFNEEECENESSFNRNSDTEYAKETCEKKKCSGCYPTYQPNQLAHMDYGGCLYTDDI
jgi:hypothetical protein